MLLGVEQVAGGSVDKEVDCAGPGDFICRIVTACAHRIVTACAHRDLNLGSSTPDYCTLPIPPAELIRKLITRDRQSAVLRDNVE
ncbi:hypothetical protein J6590_059802 [Homalodisca vitripennis]|nr:hypothetical protein J6590_059802 [Homalodisca vitripennis]